jgi:hypothetical protein
MNADEAGVDRTGFTGLTRIAEQLLAMANFCNPVNLVNPVYDSGSWCNPDRGQTVITQREIRRNSETRHRRNLGA